MKSYPKLLKFKNIIFLILVFQTLSNYSQTKNETIEWLNLKLEEYGDNAIMGTYQISIVKNENYGEILMFKKKSWNPLLEKITYDYFTFLPKNIISVYVSSKNRTNNTLDIFVVSKEKTIYYANNKKTVSEITISMKNGNNEMTGRIKKGIIHLLSLFGNNIKESKELFKD